MIKLSPWRICNFWVLAHLWKPGSAHKATPNKNGSTYRWIYSSIQPTLPDRVSERVRLWVLDAATRGRWVNCIVQHIIKETPIDPVPVRITG